MYVSTHMTNLIDVQMDEDGFLQDVYECFIQTFSKAGDLVLDNGSENGNIYFAVVILYTATCNIQVQQYTARENCFASAQINMRRFIR